ncbi:MAG: general secretion pathway protein GspE [Planctomycetales bacterium]|nr:general secretion pathway protein GspE [Planctomycetales bacterium]
MPAEIDVYREWLGIKETERPLSHYQLLRLPQFEDDPVKVRSHYRKMNAHVRKFAAGDYAAQSQELLNELAKAMLCLTDARRKEDYDASLGRAGGGGKKRTLEQILLGRKVIEPAQLEKARKYASAVGLEIRDALVQQKLAKPEVVMQVYAESEGLPYVELSEMVIDPELVAKVPAVTARHHSCVPVLIDEGQLLMASPNPLAPEVEDDLRLRIGMPVRSVLCTATGVNDAIKIHFPKEAAQSQIAAAGAKQAAPSAEKSAEGEVAAATLDPAAAAERAKQRKLSAVMAFNFIFMATMFYLMMFKSPPTGFVKALIFALPLGAVVAGAVFALFPSGKK